MTSNPKESPASTEPAAEWSTETARIVAELEGMGIGFRLSGDEVFVRGWRSLRRSTRDLLRAVKPEVIALLQARAANAPDGRRIDPDRDLGAALCPESRQGSSAATSAPSARKNPWARPPAVDPSAALAWRRLYHARQKFARWAEHARGGGNRADPYRPRGVPNPGPPPDPDREKPAPRVRLEWERRFPRWKLRDKEKS